MAILPKLFSPPVDLIWETLQGDTRVCDKQRERIEYRIQLVKRRIARLWQMKKVVVIPIVIGALGTITTKFEEYIESLGIEIRIERIRKSALLGTASIIRKIYTVLLSTQERILV